MNIRIPCNGFLTVYRSRNGYTDTVYKVKNAISSAMYNNLANVLVNRSVEYGYDAMAWGSFVTSCGSYVDSDYSGTTSTGTQGALIQSVSSNVVRISGTWTFSTTKQINMFRAGRGYTPAGAGVTELFTTLYNYDSSLLTGSTYLTYLNGDTMIIDWQTQIG